MFERLSWDVKVLCICGFLLQIEPGNLVEVERDYPSICKRYSKLYVVPEFSKVGNLPQNAKHLVS